MNEVLNDLSESALVNAIETNLYAATPFPYSWPGAEVYAGEDISWCLTDTAAPMANPVFRARLEPDNLDRTVKNLIAKANERKVPLVWWITRDTRPDDLGERLVGYGFNFLGDGAGMAIDLLAMNESVSVPPALTITEVNGGKDLESWCRVVTKGFSMPEHVEAALLEWCCESIKIDIPAKFYLALLGDEPVATSLSLFAEGVAGLYYVATLPEARRQGIGFAVTLRPLQDAREMGYRVGILQASQLGEPVYRRMGFKKYSVISAYAFIDDFHKNLSPEKK